MSLSVVQILFHGVSDYLKTDVAGEAHIHITFVLCIPIDLVIVYPHCFCIPLFLQYCRTQGKL